MRAAQERRRLDAIDNNHEPDRVQRYGRQSRHGVTTPLPNGGFTRLRRGYFPVGSPPDLRHDASASDRAGIIGSHVGATLLGQLYERALIGEQCWVRTDNGELRALPVQRWRGGRGADALFDRAVVAMCHGPTIDLGCGPGRLVARLIQHGIPALGVDQSATAVQLARRSGAPILRRNLFDPLPATGRWQTVLLIDGNVGLDGDAHRVLSRARQLLQGGGRCLAEFDSTTTTVATTWARLETVHSIGPWFRWASVGLDTAATLADDAGLVLSSVHHIGRRVIASLTAA